MNEELPFQCEMYESCNFRTLLEGISKDRGNFGLNDDASKYCRTICTSENLSQYCNKPKFSKINISSRINN